MNDNAFAAPVVGVDLAELSQKQIEDAAEDVRTLLAESPIIPKLVMVEIVARRLFRTVRSAMERELVHGWDVEQLQLVLQALGRSAQAEAENNPGTPIEIQQQLLETVIPVMDIFVQMEIETRKNNEATNKDAKVFSGDDAEETGAVGAVSFGSDGDAKLEAGECSERDQGEDGEA